MKRMHERCEWMHQTTSTIMLSKHTHTHVHHWSADDSLNEQFVSHIGKGMNSCNQVAMKAAVTINCKIIHCTMRVSVSNSRHKQRPTAFLLKLLDVKIGREILYLGGSVLKVEITTKHSKTEWNALDASYSHRDIWFLEITGCLQIVHVNRQTYLFSFLTCTD